MQELVNFLGFTSLESTIWNIIGYGAFMAIIVGVLYEKYRKPLFVIGPLLLIPYAGIFLKDPVFTNLQILITVAGILQLLNQPQRFSMKAMILLTIAAFASLVFNGSLVDVWALVGSLGLLGIAFGSIRLPKHDAFALMTIGGLLLIVYSYVTQVWIFFFLNIFFVVANIKNLYIFFESKPHFQETSPAPAISTSLDDKL